MSKVCEIPTSFVIANNVITVEMRPYASENDIDGDKSYYGQWIDAENKIVLYEIIMLEDGTEIELSKEQILNSFWHEVVHCFMFFAGMRQSEMIAQVMANFVREFQTSKKYGNT